MSSFASPMPTTNGPRSRGPLAGIRVVDLSTMLMAPYATQILGDMGADILKVESPAGDPVRGIGPLRSPGMGSIFLQVNRSKRSIVLDLKMPEGRAALDALLARADVFVYNVRPQAMARLDLAPCRLSALNPRLVTIGLYGYGQDGPYAGKPAFDDLIQGAIGVPALTQMAIGGEPHYAPTAIVDRGVALWAVGQVNAALLHQARTGEGQHIGVPMFEMMASFVLGDHLAGHAFDPPLGPLGYARMINPDRRPYRTLDGYVCAMVYTDGHWKSFYKALGREADFERDTRLQGMTSRTQHIKDIYRELGELLRTQTTAYWLELFDRADIPAMPMHTPDSLIHDPHLQATQFFRTVEHPSEGRLVDMAYPSVWSRTQPEGNRMPPRLGEHSAEILREVAGYSDEKIALLQAQGVTFDTAPLPQGAHS
jgi:crotonobetainyl-CoA:carnitine CoA-transferase CaiB-like acyl-CoA transferase